MCICVCVKTVSVCVCAHIQQVEPQMFFLTFLKMSPSVDTKCRLSHRNLVSTLSTPKTDFCSFVIVFLSCQSDTVSLEGPLTLGPVAALKPILYFLVLSPRLFFESTFFRVCVFCCGCRCLPFLCYFLFCRPSVQNIKQLQFICVLRFFVHQRLLLI